MITDTISIRQADIGDVPFIFATALRNAWYSKDLATTLPKDKYMKLKHFEVEKAIDLYMTAVACLTEDPDIILGYIINSPAPFMYIKKAWRGTAGIEAQLKETINKYNALMEKSNDSEN